MRTSAAGIQLIKRFEGFAPNVYDDGTGVMTIGYGTTGADVHPLPRHVTEAQATALLVRELAVKYEPAIRALFEADGPLRGLFNQNRFDAFVSFVYNLGVYAVPHRGRGGNWWVAGEFGTIGRAINARELPGIARAMLLYSDPGNSAVHAGLLRRRREEAALFLKAPSRWANFTPEERELILAFDALRGHNSLAARAKRTDLQRRLRKRLDAIRAAAREANGWDYHRRRERANSIKERLK